MRSWFASNAWLESVKGSRIHHISSNRLHTGYHDVLPQSRRLCICLLDSQPSKVFGYGNLTVEAELSQDMVLDSRRPDLWEKKRQLQERAVAPNFRLDGLSSFSYGATEVDMHMPWCLDQQSTRC